MISPLLTAIEERFKSYNIASYTATFTNDVFIEITDPFNTEFMENAQIPHKNLLTDPYQRTELILGVINDLINKIWDKWFNEEKWEVLGELL